MEGKLTEINRNEVLLYLGWRGEVLEPEQEDRISRCETAVLERSRPRVVWRRFALGTDGRPAGTSFVPAGRDVQKLLCGCEAVIFFAATLGTEFEALLRRAQMTDMADAVILDACGSAAVENVCDNLCRELASAESPLYLTDRFSPGYGDMPLAQQPELCRLLDVSRRIGVTLTDSGLMLPQKTVTALAGVSAVPAPRRSRGCAYCGMFSNCLYRKEGTACGKN